MPVDFWDFTNYQHPPCMFTLWYVALLANAISSYIEEWMEAERQRREETQTVGASEPVAEEEPVAVPPEGEEPEAVPAEGEEGEAVPVEGEEGEAVEAGGEDAGEQSNDQPPTEGEGGEKEEEEN